VDRRARLINGFFQPSTIFARNIGNTSTGKDAFMNLRLLALFGLVALMISPTRLLSEPLSGLVVDESGAPTAGVFVSVANRALGLTVSVITDESGRYTLPDLPLDSLRVHGVGYTPANVNIAGGVPESITLAPAANFMSQLPGASFLDMLPDDETTRQFIIGCTGCHQLDYPIGRNRGWLSETQWTQRAQQMLAWYGPRSGFPIIPERDPAETAAWLVSHLNDDNPIQPTLPQPITGEAAQAIITEYDFPGAGPHDLGLTPDGEIIITGMFSGDMWTLNPDTADFTRHAMPAGADPRAVVVGEDGAWWIVFGSLQQVARYEPATGDLQRWSVGVYAHSIALDAQGRAWANGHFTVDPVRVAMVDPAQSRPTFFAIPTDDSSVQDGLPISYDLNVAPDGTIWMSELHWNRIVQLDPDTSETRAYELPETFSAPRRFDFDSDGNLWIPEYAGGKLAKFDPAAEAFTEWELPISNSAPYVVKVDTARNRVWIALSAANSIARFDIDEEAFTIYRLPTAYALMRHMVIEPASGDVWVSYHHVPTVTDRIARLQVQT
jgi:streptogramin lyase